MLSKDDNLRHLISEQAAEWHVIHGEGPLSPQQAGELMRWLRTSPLHPAEYLSIAELERGIAEVARADTTSLEDLLEDAATPVQWLPTHAAKWPHRDNDVLAGPRGGMRQGARHRTSRGGWVVGLAIAVAVVVAALVGWNWLGSGATLETFSTGRGQERTTRLPDHTVLRLDADSRVVVHFSRARREVAVERGQAYFEVAADPGRPFGVRAGPVSIRDIGTAFNVYRHSAATTVTVVEGNVQVSDPGAPAPSSRAPAGSVVRLGPGEQVKVSDSGRVLAYGTADMWQTLAWMHGRITFEAMPITEVASRFNRYNATQITVVDPSIGAIRITGTFQSHGVASFIRFLEGLPGVAIRTRGQRVTVEAAPHRN
ncbi:MAG: FecR family protein [Rhodanobacteraceae bacterium]